MRHGRVTAEIAGALNGAGARPVPTDGGAITLATRNDTVSRINKLELERLPGSPKTAKASVTGDFGGRTFPADEALELKVGAQVMFLRNDSEQRWVNGSVGVVTKIRDTVFVELDGEEVEVQPTVWEKYKYSYSQTTKELKKDIVAEFQLEDVTKAAAYFDHQKLDHINGEYVRALPVATFVRFCHNHGLLQVSDRPQWRTVRGGSRNYVSKLLAAIPDRRLACPVLAVSRAAAGGPRSVTVTTAAGGEQFDQVVLACHSDQTLALLADARADERAVLSAVRYQPNRAVLHTDTRCLPASRKAWSRGVPRGKR